MKTWTKKEMEKFERRVSPWLEEHGIPIQNYRKKLEPYRKALLYDLVCGRALCISDSQIGDIRDLVKKLMVMVESRTMRLPTDQVDHLKPSDLMEFFPPQDYLKRF